MKQKFLWLLMSLCAVAFVACGSDDDDDKSGGGGNAPTGKVTLAQAVGTWEVTSEIKWKVENGTKFDYDEDYDADPDWIVIKADGTFEFWDYSDETGKRHLEATGPLDIENGYVVGNGMVKFTGVEITGSVMKISYTEFNHDGKGYDKYYIISYKKVK